jgi:F0F1-type ATP synthase membrane subunit c/vacuolar-type H+-ATPase subunit K
MAPALGMLAGQKLRDFIPANVFKTAVLVIVLLSGLTIIGVVIMMISISPRS